MPRTNRIAKNALSISLLGLLVTGTLALAETQKVTDLLSSGYEIKAAYQSPARVGTVHFLILQKGSSAFQCMSYGSELRPKFFDYSNTYSCAEVQDLIPVQPNLGQ